MESILIPFAAIKALKPRRVRGPKRAGVYLEEEHDR